jgi:hypothetical protein
MAASLIRVTHGVWRPLASLSEDVDRIAALVTACPDGTVICGVSAARLHGLWLPPGLDGTLEVIVHRDEPAPRRRPHGRRREVVTHRYVLGPGETVLLHRMLVTDVARSWFDLARVLTMPELVAAGDSALRGLTDRGALSRAVAANARRPGAGNARRALPLLDGRSRSRPESHLRYALLNAGLPAPKVNEPIYDEHGDWLAEPDLAYDDVRIALEYNGAEHAELCRMRRDMTRALDMVDRGGWLTLGFGPTEVFRRPDQISTVVGRLRRERCHLIRARDRR